ncbi:sulfotransferase [Ideonella sp.]|uniref:tetratricopeptide repeat-containing sulfotransferase family protein n=1 Tax=Ideonella sp. TaxID=1929293 RepID=UPI0035AF2B64
MTRRLEMEGRHAEAAGVYGQLLSRHPDWLDGWYNLGQALWRARRFEEAMAAYQRALDGGIARPEEVHLNRSVLLARHLARPDDARHELQQALRHHPGYTPAWLNLGNLYEQTGDREQAALAYERTLELSPGHALALSRLAGLQRCESAHAPIVGRLRQALDNRSRHPAERADLGFALGKALDDAGAYDEAFAAYTTANQDCRLASGVAPYDAAACEAHVRRLVDTFRAAPAGAADGSASPIFICGLFRSGSTLIERVLAAHPRVTAGGELDLVPALAAAHLPAGAAWPVLDDAAGLARLARGYQAAVGQRFPGADVLTDKRPDNFLHVGLIKAMFPRARIVLTQRHPLDNGLSMYFLHLGRTMPYATDLAHLGHWISQHDRLCAHWRELYGDDVLTLDYDRFVRNPETEARRLLAFCGLAWDPAVLDFHQLGGPVQTASLWQVRQPLYQHASGRWRHYARHLAPLERALAMGRARTG